MHEHFARIGATLASLISTALRLGVGRTRAGVLIAADRLDAPRATVTLRRLGTLLLGATLIGLGVALFVHAHLGLPPYDVMVSVLRDRFGISMGQAIWVMSAVLFGIAASLGQRPGIWTIAYIGTTGITVDIAVGLVKDPEPLAVRIVFLLLGSMVIVAGVTLVVHSALTGGAFELLMRAGAARGKDPLRIRSALELGLLFAGVGLGGEAGVGTIFYALVVGPLMRSAQIALEDHRRGREVRLGGDQSRARPMVGAALSGGPPPTAP